MPYKFAEWQTRWDPLGVFGSVEIVQNVCEAACSATGAQHATIYQFEAETPDEGRREGEKQHLALFGQPVSFPESEFPDEERATAAKAADIRHTHQESRDGKNIVYIPIEIDYGLTAVLVLHLQRTDLNVSELELRAFESRVPEWRTQFSRRFLRTKVKFLGLMGYARKMITECAEKVEKEPGEERTELFVRELLPVLVKLLEARMAIHTMQVSYPSGKVQVARSFCVRGANPDDVEFDIEKPGELVGPCKDVDKKQSVLLYGPGRQQSRVKSAFRGKRASLFKECIQSLDGHWTFIAAPTSFHDSESRSVAVSFLIGGTLHLRESFKRVVLEAGRLIGASIQRLRALDSQAAKDRHKKHLDERRRLFATVSNGDELAKAVLKGLGNKAWGLAEDAAIWLHSSETDQLVLRSVRGNLLEALEKAQITLLPRSEHPLLKEFTRHDSQGYFKAPSFETKTVSLTGATGRLEKAYSSNNLKWLLSFPIVETNGKLLGCIDCVRSKSLKPVEAKVLSGLLEDYVSHLAETVIRIRLDQVRRAANFLAKKSRSQRRRGESTTIYSTIVRKLTHELNCTHCEVYKGDTTNMRLRASTRIDEPSTEDFLKAISDPTEAMGYALTSQKAAIYHSENKSPVEYEHLFGKLKNYTQSDARAERLVVPLCREEPKEVEALIYFVGPRKNKKDFKRSALFTPEDLRLAIDLGNEVHRVMRIAKLDEARDTLMLDFVHTIGQSTQVLRSSTNKFVRLLRNANEYKDEAEAAQKLIKRADKLLKETSEQMSEVIVLPKKSYRLETGDLSKLVSDICVDMDTTGQQRGINVISHVPSNDVQVPFDEVAMRVVLVNLLENAIKYSFDRRKVYVNLKNENDEISLKVTNFGVGVPEAHWEKVFEPYFRSRVVDARGQRQGTGIGLLLVHAYVAEGHGGSVELISRPWSGVVEAGTPDIEHTTKVTVKMTRTKLEELASENSTGEK